VSADHLEPARLAPDPTPHRRGGDIHRPAAADAEPTLNEYLDTLAEGRWLIAVVTAGAVFLGGLYAVLAPPRYRSDALIQVEDKKSSLGLLGDLAGALGEASPAETEIEILRSRTLVGQVVDDLALDVIAMPRAFPVIGGAISRLNGGEEVAAPFLWLSSFAWGGERIRVATLEVHPDLLGEKLVLTALGEGHFALAGPGGPILDGRVGEEARTADVMLYVSELRARPGTRFRIIRERRDQVIKDIQEELRILETGKKTGVLRLEIEGRSPVTTSRILNRLSEAYLKQNVMRRSAEAAKTLEFLESQLPSLRSELDKVETELERYRSKNGSVNVTMETQAAVQQAATIEKALSEVRLEHAALRQRFTESHPALVALRDKIRSLERESNQLEARFRQLPEAELESAKRIRDVQVANELYVSVLNKAQELRVLKEGTIGNVRILDSALVPFEPISPRRGRTVGLALLVGLALGVTTVFVRRAIDRGVEDPDLVERETGVGVHATVPFSATQQAADRRRARSGPGQLLARADPKDLAIEGLRSLRTSLEFELLEASNNVIAIGGPAPAIGKSFVVSNLAMLLGETGKRVLLIDADLRRGRLHEFFSVERSPGLSEVVGGLVPAAAAVRATGYESVDVLTTGVIPPNPAELLGSERFRRQLEELARRYDVVLVDTPPILAVTDGALVGRHAGSYLMVLKAGRHPMREIAAAMRTLARNGVRVRGFVMNDVRLDRGLGRRSAYHYQYKYE
jgi:tyrosine-protein kinase Etk/Wzc